MILRLLLTTAHSNPHHYLIFGRSEPRQGGAGQRNHNNQRNHSSDSQRNHSSAQNFSPNKKSPSQNGKGFFRFYDYFYSLKFCRSESA